MKRLTEHDAAEHRINENRAVAIVPAEGDKAALSGFLGSCFLSKPGVQTGVSRAHDFDPPIKNIAYSRLACLNAVIAGQYRAFDDTTDSRDILYLLIGSYHAAIACRGADGLDQYTFFDSAGDRAIVNVEFPDRDGNAFRESEFLCPFGTKRPSCERGIPRPIVKTPPQVGQFRIE